MTSLMTDYYLAGGSDDLRVYHRTSLLLHLGNTALLAVLLYLLFAEPIVAAGVALLFGLHPITVDSVCWLSERKTVLASFFALGSLILYVRFAQRQRTGFYLGCLFAYILALLSKPITVPLPAMMLLMDYWPLHRLSRRCVIEKLPLLAIGAASSVVTYVSQRGTAGAYWPDRGDLLHVPMTLCYNVIFYLCKLVCPLHLSPHYEPPDVIGFTNPVFITSSIISLLLAVFLVLLFRRAAAPLVGILIFFVMLLPAMGVIRITTTLVANRYVYLPSIGMMLVLAWLLVRLPNAFKKWVPRASCLGIPLIIVVFGALEGVGTRLYLSHWSSIWDLHPYILRLFPHAPLLHIDYGYYLLSKGQPQVALGHFRSALCAKPNDGLAHYNLALALDQTDADTEEIVRHYRKAIELVPASVMIRVGLGMALYRRGAFDQGLSALREAVDVEQGPPHARYTLGRLLVLHGQTREGLACLGETLHVSPRFLPAIRDLAWFLATHPTEEFRNPREAVLLAERAKTITRGHDASVLGTLAAAYACDGRYDKAANTAKEAVKLFTRLGDNNSTKQIEERLRLYEALRPYREDPRVQLEKLLSESKTKSPSR
jgi:tetratricopeptide (TPR) repeat protein